MNEHGAGTQTRDRLIASGCKLFAAKGFDASSLREITHDAKANLGAVTYHFGSKAAFYEAVVGSLAEPFRQRIAAAAAEAGPPLTRLERVVRTLFSHLLAHPELPQIMVQQLASGGPLPAPARRTLEGNIGTLATLIAQGQADGSIRPGDPRLLALSIGAQPMFLNIVRHYLHDALALDQTNPDVRARLIESVVTFAIRGLASHPEPSS